MRTNADDPRPEDGIGPDEPWQPGEPAILDGEHEVKIIRETIGGSGFWNVIPPPIFNSSVASVSVHKSRLSRPPLAVAAEAGGFRGRLRLVDLVARIEDLEALAKVQDQRIERIEGHIENLNATSAAVLGQLKVIEDDLPIVVSQLRKRLEALEARPMPSEATVNMAERLGNVEQVAASLIDRVKTLELERFAKQPPATENSDYDPVWSRYEVAAIDRLVANERRIRAVLTRVRDAMDLDDVLLDVAVLPIPIGLPAEHYRSLVDYLARAIFDARSILDEAKP